MDWLTPALIAAAVTVVVTGWQTGGHLSILRRRLSQELDVLNKIPVDAQGRGQFKNLVESQIDEYLAWAKKPLTGRIFVQILTVAASGVFVFNSTVLVLLVWLEVSPGTSPVPPLSPKELAGHLTWEDVRAFALWMLTYVFSAAVLWHYLRQGWTRHKTRRVRTVSPREDSPTPAVPDEPASGA